MAITLRVASIAQDKAIWIGDVELHLGMPETDAPGRLTNFKIVKQKGVCFVPCPPDGAQESFTVQTSADQPTAWHTLVFNSGKLVSVRRDLGSTSNSEALGVLSRLFSALVSPITVSSTADGHTATSSSVAL